jgi:hypothetical protein
MKAIVAILVLVSSAGSQVVIEPSQISCREELVKPNLEVTVRQRITGELKDATGAAFSKSAVVLRKQDAQGKFFDYRRVVTRTNGEFDLRTVEPGQYRFLPAPNRGWKQPSGVTCRETPECRIKLVLEINPTDQRFAGCPIR